VSLQAARHLPVSADEEVSSIPKYRLLDFQYNPLTLETSYTGKEAR
jgi:hypothetical protein